MRYLRIMAVNCVLWELRAIMAPKLVSFTYTLLSSNEEAVAWGHRTVIWNIETRMFAFHVLWQNFINRYKGTFDYWIGLHRKSSKHPWRWMDNTAYNSSYVFKHFPSPVNMCCEVCELCILERNGRVVWSLLYCLRGILAIIFKTFT